MRSIPSSYVCQQVHQQPNGTIRETRAWRREHLPLFELVRNQHYAEKYDRPLVLELGGVR